MARIGRTSLFARERAGGEKARSGRISVVVLVALVAGGAAASFAYAQGEVAVAAGADLVDAVQAPSQEQIERGRLAVLTHACGDCHGGGDNPAAEGWLAGNSESVFAEIDGAEIWVRNLTPDEETGLGRVSERQIFNSLRYGLRPSETPDVEITSAVPGQGNHPASPNYLAPDMPWVFWRYMSDQELWDIAAYLKHGLKPVSNEIPPSDAPEDKWASRYAVDSIGTHVLPPFPAAREELRTPEKRAQVLRGRELVASRACSGCHGGTPPSAGRAATALHPGQENWLVGMTSPEQEFRIGDCEDPESEGCFVTRPRNLTPHNTTGIGRFTERQIFNALRFGLRPGETPDVEITSTVPGEGNFPEIPKYLAPPMPWPSWRHLPDRDLWDIAAYLKHGVKPVENKVEDSEGPPDFWAGLLEEFVRPLPAAEFPTDNEVAPEN